MSKKGYYFINTDIYNKRAHSIQISHTIEALNVTNDNLEMYLVAPLYNKQLSIDDAFSYYNIKNKFKVIFVSSFLINKPGRISFIIYGFLSISKLIYWRLTNKVDFIYFRSEYFWPLAFISKILGVPYYYEIHRQGMNRKSNFVKNLLARHAKGLVTITGQLAQFYNKFNSKIVVAHDAVDVAKFNIDLDRNSARDKLRLNKDRKIILYAGSVKKIKGVDIIIRNANKFPDIDFYMLGNTDKEMAGYIEKYKRDNLIAVGHVDNYLIPIYLKAADLLIMPHAENVQSQSPMKLFEYLASGTPIISSDLENIREVLSDEEAVFFEGGNDQSYISAINKFLEQFDKYNANTNLRLTKAKEYSWENRGKAIGSLLLE